MMHAANKKTKSGLLVTLGIAAILGGCGGGGEDLPCEQNTECAQGFACDKDGVCVAATPLEITNGSLPDATVGQNYTIVITAGGGIPPHRYSLREAPAWLSIGNDDGVLSGRPGNDDAGAKSLKVVVFDSSNHGNGQSVEKTFSLTVRECSGPADCFLPESGQCWKGTQECRDGKLLSCVKTETPSDDMAHCGDSCNACPGLRANRCEGTCLCSAKPACGEGQGCCNGACIDILTDRENCGGCGIVCDAAALGVLTAFCQNGACDYDICNQGFLDCDGDRSNGCEVWMEQGNCGECGRTCGERATCRMPGGCVCEGGYGDCNDSQADGCESELNTLDHCGSCQRDCAQLTQHVTEPKCEQGNCDYGACLSQFGDCDQQRPNGCEEDLWQLAACGTTCQNRVNCTQTVQHASGTACDQGSCDYAQCASGYGDCDQQRPNGCETPMNQTTSCGSACGQLHDCTQDVQNASNISCTAAGACNYGQCNTGFGDCDSTRPNGCETNMRVVNSCGTTCGALRDCNQDVQNASNISCTAAGACNYGQCNTGFGDCDSTRPNGCETNLWQTSSCGTACTNRVNCNQQVQNASGIVCNSGLCNYQNCNTGFGDCDAQHTNGCEANLRQVTSCGTNCGNRVNCNQQVQHATGITCLSGYCDYTECEPGWANCDNNRGNGCDWFVWNDTSCANNCLIGTNCTTLPHVAVGVCDRGSCAISQCQALWGNCNDTASDGCERSLTTWENCGGCNVVCTNAHGNTYCQVSGSTAVCQPTCDQLWGDCNGNPADGCESSLNTNGRCGSCTISCHLWEHCSNGVCVDN